MESLVFEAALICRACGHHAEGLLLTKTGTSLGNFCERCAQRRMAKIARKFTGGPWKVFLTPDGTNVIGIGEATGEGVTDCGFGVWRSGEEAKANAHLIAAAPELYEVLEAMIRACVEQGTLFAALIAYAEAALKKARGEDV